VVLVYKIPNTPAVRFPRHRTEEESGVHAPGRGRVSGPAGAAAALDQRQLQGSGLRGAEAGDHGRRHLLAFDELRLDERQLARSLGVSRTPIREAMTLLEQEGFLRTVPRRGIFIVRKTKRQIIEMIEMWAAIESMAARLATVNASDEEIAALADDVRRIPELDARPITSMNIRTRTSRSTRRSSGCRDRT
jgi:hypothetical protein